MERLTQALLERQVRIGSGSQTFERFACFTRPKPEPAECLKHARLRVRSPGARRLAVCRPVRMAETKACGQVTLNDEPSLMNRPMVLAARQHQVQRIVVASLGAMFQVMHVAIGIAAP